MNARETFINAFAVTTTIQFYCSAATMSELEAQMLLRTKIIGTYKKKILFKSATKFDDFAILKTYFCRIQRVSGRFTVLANSYDGLTVAGTNCS